MELPDIDKRTSILHLSVKYKGKKFYGGGQTLKLERKNWLL